MITTTQMYWLVTLDSLVGAGVFFAILFGIATLGAIGFVMDIGGGRWPVAVCLAGFVCSVAVATFTPTTKQMAAIIVVPKIVNNEKVQAAGDRLYGLAVEWMDELRPKRSKKEDK